MAPFQKMFLLALALLLVVPCASYQYIANCVPGGVVQDMKQTSGKIGLYVLVLQQIMPTIYGNLHLIAQGPGLDCNGAANLVNTNMIYPERILTHYPSMTQVGAVKSLNTAKTDMSYLYVFRNVMWRKYSVIADCVPGLIVQGLNQTGGRIALYTVALKTILPDLFGDLLYLGQGNNSACIDTMNMINEGNKSIVNLSRKKNTFGMHEVGVMQGLKFADKERSYLYVFKNKMWNTTWNVMLPNLQHYGVDDN